DRPARLDSAQGRTPSIWRGRRFEQQKSLTRARIARCRARTHWFETGSRICEIGRSEGLQLGDQSRFRPPRIPCPWWSAERARVRETLCLSRLNARGG